jgi:hypothetical protein
MTDGVLQANRWCTVKRRRLREFCYTLTPSVVFAFDSSPHFSFFFFSFLLCGSTSSPLSSRLTASYSIHGPLLSQPFRFLWRHFIIGYTQRYIAIGLMLNDIKESGKLIKRRKKKFTLWEIDQLISIFLGLYPKPHQQKHGRLAY